MALRDKLKRRAKSPAPPSSTTPFPEKNAAIPATTTNHDNDDGGTQSVVNVGRRVLLSAPRSLAAPASATPSPPAPIAIATRLPHPTQQDAVDAEQSAEKKSGGRKKKGDRTAKATGDDDDERVRRLDERVSEVYPHLAPTKSSRTPSSSANNISPSPSPRGPRQQPRSVSSPKPAHSPNSSSTPTAAQAQLLNSSTSTNASTQGQARSRHTSTASSNYATTPESSPSASQSKAGSKAGSKSDSRAQAKALSKEKGKDNSMKAKYAATKEASTSKRASWLPDSAFKKERTSTLHPPTPSHPTSPRSSLPHPSPPYDSHHRNRRTNSQTEEEDAERRDLPPPLPTPASLRLALHAHAYHVLLYHPVSALGISVGEEERVRADLGWDWVVVPGLPGSSANVSSGAAGTPRDGKEGHGKGGMGGKGDQNKNSDEPHADKRAEEKATMSLSLNASWPLLLGKGDCIFKGPGEVLKRGTWVVPCISTSGGAEGHGGGRQYVARVVGWEGKLERPIDVPTTLPQPGQTYITPPVPSPFPSASTASIQYLMCVLGEATSSPLDSSSSSSSSSPNDHHAKPVTSTKTHVPSQSLGSLGSPLDGEFELVQSFDDWRRAQVGEVKRVEEAGRGWWMRVVDVLSVEDPPSPPPLMGEGEGVQKKVERRGAVKEGERKEAGRQSGVTRKGSREEKELPAQPTEEGEDMEPGLRKTKSSFIISRKTSHTSTSDTSTPPSGLPPPSPSPSKLKWSFNPSRSTPSSATTRAQAPVSPSPAPARPAPKRTSTLMATPVSVPLASAAPPSASGFGSATGNGNGKPALTPRPIPTRTSTLPAQLLSSLPPKSPTITNGGERPGMRPRQASQAIISLLQCDSAPATPGPSSPTSSSFPTSFPYPSDHRRTSTSSTPHTNINSHRRTSTSGTGTLDQEDPLVKLQSQLLSQPLLSSKAQADTSLMMKEGRAPSRWKVRTGKEVKGRRYVSEPVVGQGGGDVSGVGGERKEVEEKQVEETKPVEKEIKPAAGKRSSSVDRLEERGVAKVDPTPGVVGVGGKDMGAPRPARPQFAQRASTVRLVSGSREEERLPFEWEGVDVPSSPAGSIAPRLSSAPSSASTLGSQTTASRPAPMTMHSSPVIRAPPMRSASTPVPLTRPPPVTAYSSPVVHPTAVVKVQKPTAIVRSISADVPVASALSSPKQVAEKSAAPPPSSWASTFQRPLLSKAVSVLSTISSVSASTGTSTPTSKSSSVVESNVSKEGSSEDGGVKKRMVPARASVVNTDSLVSSVHLSDLGRQKVAREMVVSVSVVDTESLMSSIHLDQLHRVSQLPPTEGFGERGGKDKQEKGSLVSSAGRSSESGIRSKDDSFKSFYTSSPTSSSKPQLNLKLAHPEDAEWDVVQTKEGKSGLGLPEIVPGESLSAGFLDEVLAAVPSAETKGSSKVRGGFGGVEVEEGKKRSSKKGRRDEGKGSTKKKGKETKDEGSGTMKWKDYVRMMSGSSSSPSSPSMSPPRTQPQSQAQPQAHASTSATGSPMGKKSRTRTNSESLREKTRKEDEGRTNMTSATAAATTTPVNDAGHEGVSGANNVEKPEKEKAKAPSSGSRFVEGDEIGEGFPVKVRDPSLRR